MNIYQNLECRIKAQEWGRPVRGDEKPELLGWEPKRIIKTIYFQKDSTIYGVILPLDRRVKQSRLKDPLELSSKQVKRLKLATTFPIKQQPHSLGPFIEEEDLDLVGRLVFTPLETEDLVDFTFPGRPDISIHMKYKDAHDIVKSKFDGLVAVYDATQEFKYQQTGGIKQ